MRRRCETWATDHRHAARESGRGAIVASFVGLLRGVNVGKAKRIAMADWRAQLEKLGYSDVATLLNSGNAVFGAPMAASTKHAGTIAAALANDFGLNVRVIVKSSTEFSSVLEENPFRAKTIDPTRVLVAFSQEPKQLAGLGALVELAVLPEEFVIGKHAAFLHCPAGILQSRVGPALLGKTGEFVTTRNWATTLKLQALLAARNH